MRIDQLAYKIVSKNRRLIPVVVQDYETREVLMLAYANTEMLKETVRTGFATTGVGLDANLGRKVKRRAMSKRSWRS